jgi:acetoin utilization protein AcuB
MIKVSQWMTKQVLVVELYDSIGVARRLMSKHRVNQLPVVANNKLVGIVTDRDIRDAYPTSMLIDHGKEIDKFAESYTVEEVMTFNVMTVQLETPLLTAVRILRRHRIGSLPVAKKEKLVGIITRSDVLDFILRGKSLKETPRRKQRKRKQRKKSRRS